MEGSGAGVADVLDEAVLSLLSLRRFSGGSLVGSLLATGISASSVHTPFDLRSKAALFFWLIRAKKILASFELYVSAPPAAKTWSS